MNTDLMNIFLKDRSRPSFSQPLIIAHRGASGYEPENTLRSFKRALEMGSSMIELDVFLCKAQKGEQPLVVMHDETIDRTTNGHGYVGEISWQQLKKYDAGKGEHIPLLSQVFDLVDKRAGRQYVVIDIELKGPGTAKPVAELINYYINNKNWNPQNFIVSSFDHNSIQEFQEYLPQVKTGAIFFRSKDDVIESTQNAKAQYIILDYQSITYDLITKAHSKGLFVFVYTVNDSAIAEELATWLIDGIITDYPNILSTSSFDPNVLH